jgi:hypothetical protein
MLERVGVRAFGTRDMEENQSNPVSRDAASRKGAITHWYCGKKARGNYPLALVRERMKASW